MVMASLGRQNHLYLQCVTFEAVQGISVKLALVFMFFSLDYFLFFSYCSMLDIFLTTICYAFSKLRGRAGRQGDPGSTRFMVRYDSILV